MNDDHINREISSLCKTGKKTGAGILFSFFLKGGGDGKRDGNLLFASNIHLKYKNINNI